MKRVKNRGRKIKKRFYKVKNKNRMKEEQKAG
jgi:hypothetical protein